MPPEDFLVMILARPEDELEIPITLGKPMVEKPVDLAPEITQKSRRLSI